MFRSGDREEERLCNVFAAELLMPAKLLRSHLDQTGATARAALKLAGLCDVSLKALVCRLRQILDPAGRSLNDSSRCFAAIWSRRRTYYAAEWSTPTAFLGMTLCDSGKTSVEKAFRTSRTEECGNDSIILDSRVTRWRCTSIQLADSKVLTVGFRFSTGHHPWLGASRESRVTGFQAGPTDPAPNLVDTGDQLALWTTD
jgi:hypothetical protein